MTKNDKDFLVDQIDRDLVIMMLQHEEELRYSDKYQDIYDDKIKNPQNYSMTSVEINLHKEVLNHFGFSDSDQSIDQYQLIPSKYRNDEEVKSSAYFIRYNIMRDSDIIEGDQYIDVDLVDLEGKSCRLSQFCSKERPLVILAGSIT